MGITIEVGGSVEPERLDPFLKWVEEKARDLDWSVWPSERKFHQAALRSGGSDEALEQVATRGLILMPHFACERLPILVTVPGGVLVDDYVDASTGASPVLSEKTLVKTQFAGPDVHVEVCELLRGMREAFVPNLTVDDESGYFATKDRAELERTMADAWRVIWRLVTEDEKEPGERFLVGPFTFAARYDEAGDEFTFVEADQRDLVTRLETDLLSRFQGFGTTLDGSRESIFDLELLFSDLDEPGESTDLDDPANEAFAHAAGAYFGRTLIKLLGGNWRNDDDEGLLVTDVGRCGLIVDPFRAAAERLAHGPAFSLYNHLHTYESLTKTVRALDAD